MYRITVACVEDSNQLSVHSFQLINKMKHVFQRKDAKITALCIGKHSEEQLKSLYHYGADEVIFCNMSETDKIKTIRVAIQMIKEQEPDLVLLPSCDWGRCTAAELSIEALAGLTADCIDIELTELNGKEEVVFSRAAINATVMAKIKCINSAMAICTFKKDAYLIEDVYETDKAEIIYWQDEEKVQKSKQIQVIERILSKKKENTAKLEEARIVFGFGRGVKSEETLELIKKLADKYHAAIAGTRAVVENGLIGKECQVGQSGINIAPDLYIAIGISGASQHMVGIKNSKKIVAINNDPSAPIFSCADYMIVDDCTSILKELWKCS